MAGKFKDTMYKIFGLENVEEEPEEMETAPEPAPIRTPGRYSGTYSGGTSSGYSSRERDREPRSTRDREPRTTPYREGGSYASARPASEPAAPSRNTARIRTENTQPTPLYSLPTAAQQQRPNNAMQMIVHQLQSYDDTQRVVDELRSGNAVIVSTERLKTEIAQRALDFIGGAIYAINGNHRKISRGIFIFAPENVDISGSYTNLLPPELRSSR